MHRSSRFLIRIVCLLFLNNVSCKPGINIDKKYILSYSQWRGAIATPGGDLPFLFYLNKPQKEGPVTFELENGEERIISKEVEIIGDSIIIRLPVYEAVLIAGINPTGDSLVGSLHRVRYDQTYITPFKAVAKQPYKFAAHRPGQPEVFQGLWKTRFITDTPYDTSWAIGKFEQNGLNISGTFLTPSGDYRYLSGIADGDSMFLSGFDGSMIFLFKARKVGKTMTGEYFTTGKIGTKFESVLDASFRLPDPFNHTQLKRKSNLFATLPDSSILSLSSGKYYGKVLVLNIMGTWCANCGDETAFMSELYRKYKDKGLEIVGLAFERTNVPEKAANNLSRMKKRFNVPYDLIHVGKADAKEVVQRLNFLRNLYAYPTTIVVSRKGEVATVHTGFSGPGTGNFYEEYKKTFTSKLEELLKESIKPN